MNVKEAKDRWIAALKAAALARLVAYDCQEVWEDAIREVGEGEEDSWDIREGVRQWARGEVGK